MTSTRSWLGPGSLMLDPSMLALVLLTALNDHWFKAIVPGLVTGKLSDLAGLGFFPLAVVSLAEIVGAAFGIKWRAGARGVTRCAVLTGLGFCAIKSSALASDVYERVVQSIWLGLGAQVHVDNVVDPTDLLALPALVVSLWVVRRRRPSPEPPRLAPGFLAG